MIGPLLRPLPLLGLYELVAGYLDVPAGFRTNGASIPRLLWPVLGSPFAPELVVAALIHDRAYQFGVPVRRKADDIFHSMLVDVGVAELRADLLWLGVRLFGWLYWRQCRYGRGIAG